MKTSPANLIEFSRPDRLRASCDAQFLGLRPSCGAGAADDRCCATRLSYFAALAFLLCLLLGSSAHAQNSATSISFQGALNGSNGQPLPNGSYTLAFQFWDHPTSTVAGNRVGGAVTLPGVAVGGGVASTAIPVQPDWFNGQTRYLGTTVQGVNAGQELLPRVLVTAVPYSVATHGISVNPPPRFDPAGALPRPNQRVVIGNTTEDISRIPPVDQALVIGTANGAAGTSVGICFDTLSRADSAIIVEKNSGTSIEDNTMRFYVGKEGELVTRKAMTINQNGNVAIGSTSFIYSRLVVGSSSGDADRMPAASEVLVVGTTSRDAGTRVGLYFDTNERNGGGILVEKVSGGSVENHLMRFYVTRDGDPLAANIMTASPTRLDVNGTTRTTVLQITSAREAKLGFASVDAAAILAKVAALPLSTWAYTNAPTVRHLGPVAQDFRAAFGLGDDDKHIATVDADGVALAAIQGLYQFVKEQQADLRAKTDEVEPLKQRVSKLERLLTAGSRSSEVVAK